MSRQTLTIKEGRQKKMREEGGGERKEGEVAKHAQRYPEKQRLTTFFVTLFLLHKELKQCPV